MQVYFRENGNVKGVIDNDKHKQGSDFYGYIVVSFEEACKCIDGEDVIVICCIDIFAKEIEKQLKGSGCKCDHYIFDERDIENLYCYNISKYIFGNCTEEGYEERLISRCCTQKDFAREDFQWAADQLKINIKHNFHRKPWERLYIVNVLNQQGLLKEEMKAIGFAVGQEPLPAYFAGRHIHVLATDLNPKEALEWVDTNQNAAGDLEKLYRENICSQEDFKKYLSFRYVDMNHIPDDLKDFDFCWSSCAVEHVGSLAKSIECIKNMLNVLKPGGLAINTTEFNLSSNIDTIEEGNSIIFRRKDIEDLVQWCEDNGHHLEVSFKRGSMKGDRYIDIPPYKTYNAKYHLNIMIGKYASTSFAIIIRKNSNI